MSFLTSPEIVRMLQAEREREIAAQERIRMAQSARPRGPRFGSIRRRIGGMLVRTGLRLIPRESRTAAGSTRLTTAGGTATPRG